MPPLLAATGVQAFTRADPNIYQLTPANLAEDVDVVSAFVEFYGVPWSSLASGQGLPPAWVARMEQLAAQTRALGKPVLLSLTLGRSGLHDDVVVTGSRLSLKSNWAPCYDFHTAVDGQAMRAAWLEYVRFMQGLFSPAYLNIGTELSTYQRLCPTAFASVVEVSNAAWEAAHARDPNVVVFPSFVLEELYGRANCPGQDAGQCSEALRAAIVPLQRDRFALSVYPSRPDVDEDYFTRFAPRIADGGTEPVIIAETGFNAISLVAEGPMGCLPVLDSSAEAQAEYLDRLLTAGRRHHFELINWWSDRDLLPTDVMTGCPCRASGDWCGVERAFSGGDLTLDLLFKLFGSMGLRTYDGTPREPGFSRWKAARTR